MDLFYDTISDDILYDSSKIKILDGIAGSGKTTYLSKTFEKDGVDYLHCTSTNRLKKDIEARFPNRHVKTVASGLFKGGEKGFYALPIEPVEKTVIIDEILQTEPAVIRWIFDHVGVYNIFICTDKKQTLSPEQSKIMFKRYTDLLQNENAVIIQPTVTHRPKTKETADFYYKSFADSSDDGFRLFNKLKKEFPIVNYTQLPEDFAENAAYITHTNEIEKQIYEKYNLQYRYDLPLIPKGMISSKTPKNRENYPILPQIKTYDTHMLGYWQVGNVGSVVRYQGSEVNQGEKLYYLVNKDSHPTDREIYTMITRMKDINSLVIVDYPKTEKTEIFSFNGIPILKPVVKGVLSSDTYTVNEKGEVDANGKETKALNGDEITRPIYQQLIAKIDKNIKDDECVAGIYYKGKKVNNSTLRNPKPKDYKPPKISLFSLLQKDQDLKCDSCIEEILRICDEELKLGYPISPTRTMNEQRKKISEFAYGVDVAGSYPTAFKFGYIPNGTTFRHKMDGECKMGIYIRDGYYRKNTIVMTPLYEYVMEKGDCDKIRGIGSFDRLKKTYIGDKFYTLYHKSIEDKDDAKEAAMWGILERHYLESTVKAGKAVYYKNKRNVYEPIMWAVKSYQSYNTEKMRDVVYGDGFFRRGIQNCDCLYFNTDEDIDYVGTMIMWHCENVEFRIFSYNPAIKNTSEQKILYKNYEDLPHRPETPEEKRKYYRNKYAEQRKKMKQEYTERKQRERDGY